jgi:hypothetical protein
MKKLALSLTLLLTAIISQATVVQGTVVNMSNTLVANQIVHVVDSSGGVQIFHLRDTTDASGAYSVTLPGSLANNSLLHIYTEKCSQKYTNNQIYNGADLTANFTVCGTTATTGNTVSGTVTYVTPSGSPAYPAMVYLIHKSYNNNTYTLTLIDSTNTASNGEYHFYGVTYPAGDLLAKCALLPANTNYWNYLPTYKENSLTWNNAHAVSFTLGANDIHMVAGTNTGGPGFIGGTVQSGANMVPGSILLLTTMADLGVGYTFSDLTGQFSFPNLPYGTYKLFGDALGKNNPVTIITLDATHPTANDIAFKINADDFTTGIIDLSQFSSVSLYPNPVSNELNIIGLDKVTGTKYISLTTITGIQIASESVEGDSAKLNLKGMTSGVYLIRISTASGSATYRIVK